MTSARKADHYDRLAGDYDQAWSHSPEFVGWLTAAILNRLLPGPDEVAWAADIGSGTGLFARALATRAAHVVCMDTSAKMLAEMPPNDRLIRFQAAAEDLAESQVTLPHSRFDAILVKDAIHHFGRRDKVVAALAGLLTDGGRLLVVMLPTTVDYPLFDAALTLFEQLQPDPEDVAEMMRAAGLGVDLTYESFRLSIPRDRYVQLVRSRYMSLLSEFDDDALEQGIVEIEQRHGGDRFEFVDRIAFITGSR